MMHKGMESSTMHWSYLCSSIISGGVYSRKISSLQAPLFNYSPLFQNILDTGYILNITIISDKCRHSLAVATPDKYEHDSKHIINLFCKIKIYPNGKIDKESFSNPHLNTNMVRVNLPVGAFTCMLFAHNGHYQVGLWFPVCLTIM